MCAFALKGEHNVYSLVPNISVCKYILTKSEFISNCSRPAVGLNIVKITRATFFVNVFFFKWPPVAILEVQKSLLTISDQYHNFYFCDFCLQNGRRRPFWMSENHFWSHLWPLQIDAQLFFIIFWQQAAILDGTQCQLSNSSEIFGWIMHVSSMKNVV